MQLARWSASPPAAADAAATRVTPPVAPSQTIRPLGLPAAAVTPRIHIRLSARTVLFGGVFNAQHPCSLRSRHTAEPTLVCELVSSASSPAPQPRAAAAPASAPAQLSLESSPWRALPGEPPAQLSRCRRRATTPQSRGLAPRIRAPSPTASPTPSTPSRRRSRARAPLAASPPWALPRSRSSSFWCWPSAAAPAAKATPRPRQPPPRFTPSAASPPRRSRSSALVCRAARCS